MKNITQNIIKKNIYVPLKERRFLIGKKKSYVTLNLKDKKLFQYWKRIQLKMRGKNGKIVIQSNFYNEEKYNKENYKLRNNMKQSMSRY